MSSGHSEGPSTDPDGWRSPYGTGAGHTSDDEWLPYDRERSAQDRPSWHVPSERTGAFGHQVSPYDDRAPDDAAPTRPASAAPAYTDLAYGDHGHGDHGHGATVRVDLDHDGQDRPGHADPHPPRYGHGPAEQPHAPGHGPGTSRATESVRTHAIVVMAVGIVLSLSCFLSVGGIVATVLSGLALGRVDTDTRRAGRLLRWAWIGVGANVGLIVLGGAVFVVAGLNHAFGP